MTFAELVAADMNSRHPDRARQGKPARAEDMPDWALSICNVLDKIRVYPPGMSRDFHHEEEEHVSAAELGIRR